MIYLIFVSCRYIHDERTVVKSMTSRSKSRTSLLPTEADRSLTDQFNITTHHPSYDTRLLSRAISFHFGY